MKREGLKFQDGGDGFIGLAPMCLYMESVEVEAD